jgi:hypothetical protein
MAHNSISFPDVKDALTRISMGERATTHRTQAGHLMRFWLWGCDANEVCDRGKCDFHLMHLTGMVCARVFTESYLDASDSLDVVPLVIDTADVEMLITESGIFLPHFYTIVPTTARAPEPTPENAERIDASSRDPDNTDIPNPTPDRVSVPSRISLQQLRDIVHAVQTQWPMLQCAIDKEMCPVQKKVILQTVDRLVTQLFIWFGTFLFASDIPHWQSDDTDFVEKVAPTQKMALTDMGIKFYINIFFVLFRLLFLQRHAVAVPTHTPMAVTNTTTEYPFEIESFHVEAGVDDFHMLGMYFDVPAGCLLEYKHSYSGYYNNVSQCVYRHFPSYKRRLPVSLQDILHTDAPDLSVLPALKQIYPEIEFAFEDHHFHRVVGSVHTAVLLSTGAPGQSHTETTGRVNFSPRNTPPHPTPARFQNIRSERLLARVAACKGASGGGSDSGDLDGGRSTQTTDWFWFVVGSDVYLICTIDGVAYSGRCRDLLAFYLSTTATHK